MNVSISELIAAYAHSEELFKKLYLESVNAEADKEKLVAASTIKKEVHQIQKQTVEYINAMQAANPDKYGAVSAVLAEMVKTLNLKIRNQYNN